jgi:integrase/recombinase XerD
MTNLGKAADEYLTMRRRLGYALVNEGRLLSDFVAFLARRGAEHISTELALEWAVLPSGAQPVWRRVRLGVARGFAEYMCHTDPVTQVPPPKLLPGAYCRVAPYLYSEDEIAAMMAAARQLRPPLRAATYETLIGLITVTGLRIGEAIGLDRDDIDEHTQLLTVRDGKRGGRQIPLHETTVHALADYGRIRDRQFSKPASTSLLVSIRGTRLYRSAIHATFPKLLQKSGIGADQSRRPRVHDLRHSFAVCQLLDWHRQSADVDTKLPLLTSFLGHTNPACTYWYLEASPQLLAVASDRLTDVLGELP